MVHPDSEIVKIRLDYVSCSLRVPIARLAAAQAIRGYMIKVTVVCVF